MSANTIDYARQLGPANTERGPSPAVWGTCPILDILENPGVGVYYFDDFLNFGQIISAQNVQQYASYIDTGVTIKQLPLQGGIIEFAGNDADNDEGSITTGGNTGTLAVITANIKQKLWFEARLKKAAITADSSAFFIGLGEEGLAAADTLADNTGALASKDFLGFSVLHDSGAEVDFTWRKAGQAVQLNAAVGTMTADAYVKIGFVYDGEAPTERRVSIYVNNVLSQSFVTGAQIAAATFPSGEELALLFATKVGSAVESKIQCDWWGMAQVF